MYCFFSGSGGSMMFLTLIISVPAILVIVAVAVVSILR